MNEYTKKMRSNLIKLSKGNRAEELGKKAGIKYKKC